MSDMQAYGAQGSGVPPELQTAYAELRKLPVFDGIPNEELWRAIASGGVLRKVLERDVFVDAATGTGHVAGGPDHQIYFVISGQVAVAVFDPDTLRQRRGTQAQSEAMSLEQRAEASLLKPPPLVREARKNLASFVEGDIYNAAALPASARDVAFFTVEPSVVAAINHGVIAELVARFPFFEERLRRAIEIGRERLRNIAGVKQEILDFFLRQGISVSGEMVRVRQLDRCIDCKLCEEGCEERYGSKRLTLGGYQLGMLDFVYTCRTCSDQRCIDPCEYDSIKFDAELGEVVINEASCVGCTLCAQACPYSAIEMVDVEDPNNPTYSEDFKLRLEEDGSLAFGPGRPRVGRPRRIANKCDHCQAYGDQACVSACPTGALIEISAYELFRERSPAASAVAKTGYDQEPGKERSEFLPVAPFTEGVGVSNAGMAKTTRGQLGPLLMWGLGLGGWLLALVEILLRIYSPAHSFRYMQLRFAGSAHKEAVGDVIFRPGTELALWCGYIGTALMAVAAIYPIWRRWRPFRRLASNTMWFDFHLMSGIVGPMFIILHSALKLDNWVSAAFWSMAIVVISGVVGRYLYTKVPDLLNGRELEELDHHRAFAMLRKIQNHAVEEAQAELASHEAKCHHVAANWGLLMSFFWILAEDLKRPFRRVRRGVYLRRAAAPRGIRRELAYRTARLLIIQRRRVLMPRAQLLLHSWKKVHVPFTFIMVVLSGLHIWVAWQFSM